MNYKIKTDVPDYLKIKDFHFKKYKHSLQYKHKLEGVYSILNCQYQLHRRNFWNFSFQENKKKGNSK